uniref:Uncharacterized protein n=1 Tax=Chromera velia CCMP2878 TaxID=1169474 RepID=A0A0G4H9J1_9ALVE|eukprot:Cvel_5995.t1-p1 / transcript=Cvel_5995.t1 / gene=Cvel_5995 / organism=Chromera_velia_CCMP2878 / gene_product=hypothetical protein / transcript_product=hypothetical protein / location=Cvel_scaffold287:23807-27752(+) / protein_length=1209 / sequence_SO=supercontig / SO=protein_coding / is_pseudo=false
MKAKVESGRRAWDEFAREKLQRNLSDTTLVLECRAGPPGETDTGTVLYEQEIRGDEITGDLELLDNPFTKPIIFSYQDRLFLNVSLKEKQSREILVQAEIPSTRLWDHLLHQQQQQQQQQQVEKKYSSTLPIRFRLPLSSSRSPPSRSANPPPTLRDLFLEEVNNLGATTEDPPLRQQKPAGGDQDISEIDAPNWRGAGSFELSVPVKFFLGPGPIDPGTVSSDSESEGGFARKGSGLKRAFSLKKNSSRKGTRGRPTVPSHLTGLPGLFLVESETLNLPDSIPTSALPQIRWESIAEKDQTPDWALKSNPPHPGAQMVGVVPALSRRGDFSKVPWHPRDVAQVRLCVSQNEEAGSQSNTHTSWVSIVPLLSRYHIEMAYAAFCLHHKLPMTPIDTSLLADEGVWVVPRRLHVPQAQYRARLPFETQGWTDRAHPALATLRKKKQQQHRERNQRRVTAISAAPDKHGEKRSQSVFSVIQQKREGRTDGAAPGPPTDDRVGCVGAYCPLPAYSPYELEKGCSGFSRVALRERTVKVVANRHLSLAPAATRWVLFHFGLLHRLLGSYVRPSSWVGRVMFAVTELGVSLFQDLFFLVPSVFVLVVGMAIDRGAVWFAVRYVSLPKTQVIIGTGNGQMSGVDEVLEAERVDVNCPVWGGLAIPQYITCAGVSDGFLEKIYRLVTPERFALALFIIIYNSYMWFAIFWLNFRSQTVARKAAHVRMGDDSAKCCGGACGWKFDRVIHLVTSVLYLFCLYTAVVSMFSTLLWILLAAFLYPQLLAQYATTIASWLTVAFVVPRSLINSARFMSPRVDALVDSVAETLFDEFEFEDDWKREGDRRHGGASRSSYSSDGILSRIEQNMRDVAQKILPPQVYAEPMLRKEDFVEELRREVAALGQHESLLTIGSPFVFAQEKLNEKVGDLFLHCIREERHHLQDALPHIVRNLRLPSVGGKFNNKESEFVIAMASLHKRRHRTSEVLRKLFATPTQNLLCEYVRCASSASSLREVHVLYSRLRECMDVDGSSACVGFFLQRFPPVSDRGRRAAVEAAVAEALLGTSDTADSQREMEEASAAPIDSSCHDSKKEAQSKSPAQGAGSEGAGPPKRPEESEEDRKNSGLSVDRVASLVRCVSVQQLLLDCGLAFDLEDILHMHLVLGLFGKRQSPLSVPRIRLSPVKEVPPPSPSASNSKNQQEAPPQISNFSPGPSARLVS